MLRSHHLLPAACLMAASFAAGQVTSSPLVIQVRVSGTVQTLTDNGTVQFTADAIGRPVEAAVIATYRGSGSISINRFEFTGSTDFSVSGVPAPELVFVPNDTFTVTVRFRPSTSTRAIGAIRFFYTDTPPSPPGGRAVTGSVGLNLNGVSPEFSFTVLPPPASNATPILPGETIVFPPTPVSDTASAIVVVANRGSGPGSVGLIRSAGAAFSLAALPGSPSTVDPNRDVRFTVRYAPTVIETSTGSVGIEFIDRTVTFNLSGSSTGAVFSYDLIQDSGAFAVQPGATVTVPDVNVGDKSTITFRVRNTGNADGRVTSIGVQGTGFALADVPFLPLLLTPGSAATVSVSFTPPTPGKFTGRVRIGNDAFDLVSNGLGANLTYSFIAGPVTTSLVSGGSVIFPPVAVGASSTVRFVITNTGTLSSAVNSIGVVATGTTFTASGLPALPASLGPGQTLSFGMTFTPTVTGSLTGVLRVDGLSFSLSGFANQPPVLSEYRFGGASGVQEPAQQLGVGLALAQPYPLPLTGTLTLAFNSDVFANDPAVQFAVGGRVVSFTIPAGQRDALFLNNQTQVRLQTGTVAGSLVLTPSFQSDGGIALTPQNPPSLTLTVAPAAPRVLSVQVTGKTASAFQVLVTGYATSRQITQVDLTFTPLQGENVATTKLSLPAEASFTAWYQNTASLPFGSQFTATIPLTLQGDLVNAKSLVETIRSVSVTLTNRLGTSQAASADVQ